MKIYFRYLFMRLLQPFLVALSACALVWIMADLYGNIDDFIEHKINLSLVLRFYLYNIPKLLVQVLPAVILFSTLFTLLSLNRRSELIAFQSGGMAPIWLFSPFLVFALIWMLILAWDLSGPAAEAEVERDRLLKLVKGESAHRNELTALPYFDGINHRIWYFQELEGNKGHDVQIVQQDEDGHDMVVYSANQAEWNGEFWKLNGGVVKTVYGVPGSIPEQKTFQELDLPDITTPPKQLSLIVSQPNQLTLDQLSEYIRTSTTSPENLAKYHTEWWYRVLHPFNLLVLMLFALLQGARSDRRGAVAGVFWIIVLFLVYNMVTSVFIAAGNNGRLPPFLSVLAPELIFGALGLHLLAINNRWWQQLFDVWKQWHAESDEI